MRKIKLGDQVKDKITDLEGTVVGITHYIYGCTQCGIRQKELHSGKIMELEWVDELQLELVKATKEKKTKPKYDGIRNYPKRN